MRIGEYLPTWTNVVRNRAKTVASLSVMACI